jgi:hypothetical protein
MQYHYYMPEHLFSLSQCLLLNSSETPWPILIKFNLIAQKKKKRRAWSTECSESKTIKIHSFEEELWEFELVEWICHLKNVQGRIEFEYNLSKMRVE